MLATEIRNWLNQQIQEFGDGECTIPDQLEPTWHRIVRPVRYDRQREVFVFEAERA